MSISGQQRRRVKLRDGGRCMRCGSQYGLTVHHRWMKQHGGPNSMWNLVTLCGANGDGCHQDVEADMADAIRQGFIIRGTAQEPPYWPWLVPVKAWAGWVRLTCGGSLDFLSPRSA